jgi:hypothetical protein
VLRFGPWLKNLGPSVLCLALSSLVERSTQKRVYVCHTLCRYANARAHGRVHDENFHALDICVRMYPQFGWRHLHRQCHRPKGRCTVGIGRPGADPDREQHSNILQERRDDWQHQRHQGQRPRLCTVSQVCFVLSVCVCVCVCYVCVCFRA